MGTLKKIVESIKNSSLRHILTDESLLILIIGGIVQFIVLGIPEFKDSEGFFVDNAFLFFAAIVGIRELGDIMPVLASKYDLGAETAALILAYEKKTGRNVNEALADLLVDVATQVDNSYTQVDSAYTVVITPEIESVETPPDDNVETEG